MLPVFVQQQLQRLGDIHSITPITGGDICQAFHVQTKEQRLFVKIHPNAQMLYTESNSLRWLNTPGCIRIPKIIDACKSDSAFGWLALEWIDEAPLQNNKKRYETLGIQLALLHQSHPKTFGRSENNFLGTLFQNNQPEHSWQKFFHHKRLLPQLRLIENNGYGTPDLRKQINSLLQTLHKRLADPEPPARIHGDLWSGNHLFDQQGTPVLIDPSAYGGHREMDIAMMHLFGGYPPQTFAAYQEIYPLQPGWRERIPLYQLYYLMAHLNLHGSSWLHSVTATLKTLLKQ